MVIKVENKYSQCIAYAYALGENGLHIVRTLNPLFAPLSTVAYSAEEAVAILDAYKEGDYFVAAETQPTEFAPKVRGEKADPSDPDWGHYEYAFSFQKPTANHLEPLVGVTSFICLSYKYENSEIKEVVQNIEVCKLMQDFDLLT